MSLYRRNKIRQAYQKKQKSVFLPISLQIAVSARVKLVQIFVLSISSTEECLDSFMLSHISVAPLLLVFWTFFLDHKGWMLCCPPSSTPAIRTLILFRIK